MACIIWRQTSEISHFPFIYFGVWVGYFLFLLYPFAINVYPIITSQFSDNIEDFEDKIIYNHHGTFSPLAGYAGNVLSHFA